ncbi:hypothetical protein GCM10010441_40290 [Kitasatospora paracochleata]|uniref:Uncharacterized protein n=1 Tax=Kitasatospora paracochleata TaxID=58354 RepID=A0ABT1IVU3_9ACTN|nr:hypothetical protein [Kitasatospora paracochleata]MCP2309252.1 hypothetical protein [Kitasatospora paracochleata]
MSPISQIDVAQLASELTGWHHPHFVSITKTDDTNVQWTFKPFTGSEAEPIVPTAFWRDDTLSEAARNTLEFEYEVARRLWRDARYIRDIKEAAAGAASCWDRYTQARNEMDALFTAMDTTADTHWRATVSKLLTAQEKTLAAAAAWDHKAKPIAYVHGTYGRTELTRREVYERAGIDPTDATAWVIGDDSDYDARWDLKPLQKLVHDAVEAQREHLRKVAELTADLTLGK